MPSFCSNFYPILVMSRYTNLWTVLSFHSNIIIHECRTGFVHVVFFQEHRIATQSEVARCHHWSLFSAPLSFRWGGGLEANHTHETTQGCYKGHQKGMREKLSYKLILFQYFLNRNSIPNGVPFQKGIDMVSVCLPLIFHMPAKVGGSGIVAADGRKPWTLFRNGLYIVEKKS